MKFDIVIAGGGFAGAYCARTLGKGLGRAEGRRRVALIAEQNVLVFQPMLAEVVGAALNPQDVVNPLRIFCKGVTVLKGRIHSVDWKAKKLVLDGGRFSRDHEISFDHLVLALGAITDLSKVPGLSEYGWPMKSVADALRLRAALINRLEEANLVDEPVLRARLMTFVVVGGGYTGVETAGQLRALISESRYLYSNLKDVRPRVVLVHSQPMLLAEIGPKLGKYALQVLEKNDVEVLLNTRVVEVTATKAILDKGSSIDAATLVSTIGSAPHPVIMDLCRQLGIDAQKGRIPVEPTMRVSGQPQLWAIGDGAAVPWNDKGEMKLSPPTSQFALRHGQQLARNLLRALRNQPAQPFKYRYLGQLATIGSHQAVAEILGFHFKGIIAWWMWRTIYLAKLPGLLRKLRVVVDWTFELIFARDIGIVLPPPEDVLRAIHLEKDEILINSGEKPRAYFYVRHGSILAVAKDGSQRVLPAGTVIDQDFLDADNAWTIKAAAAVRSDVVAFRGRAFELLNRELRLVHENPNPDGAKAPDAVKK